MIKLSIAIVAYHNQEDVTKTVCSILEHTSTNIQKKIYIVDNSTEKNALHLLEEKYPEVIYRKTEKNLGFGGGHNIVLPYLDSMYHAIVNPDILLTEDSFSKLIDFLEKQEAGMVIPRLVDETGVMQAACRRELTVFDMGIRMFLPKFFRKRQKYHTMAEMDYKQPFQVPFAQGSFLVIRTELFRKLGGFDSRYFMYMEDADLCRRVNAYSSVYYCPDTSVIHKWEKGSHKNKTLLKYHLISMYRYFAKWGWRFW